MVRFHKYSIKAKLVLIQLFITFIVLLLFSFILEFYKMKIYQTSFTGELISMANLIGANSASALVFLDKDAAGEILTSLKTKENIVNAWITDSKGNLFASYSRPEYNDFSFPSINHEESILEKDFILVSRKISFDNEDIGIVALRLSTKEKKQSIINSILAGLIVLFAGMIIAFSLSILTQKQITNPILNLVSTVGKVSKTKDWSIRVTKQASDEIGTLYDGFNSLLNQISTHQAERDLAYDSLRQADKMATLGILVSGVAHEINNPNNFMLLNSNNLADIWNDIKPILDNRFKTTGDFMVAGMYYSDMCDDVSQLINGIVEGAERIKNIVRNLKDFARQDTGRMDELVNINSIIESSIIILSNLIKKSTDNLTINYGDNVPEIKGNGQQLEQVVINIISNACHAVTSKRDSITITTEYRQEIKKVIVVFTDTGKGIAEEDLKHIMDPFFTTNRDSGGTGLGLSISYQMVKNHGGEIIFESELGKGTTAAIYLPVMGKEL